MDPTSVDYSDTLFYTHDTENTEFANQIGILRLAKTFATD